MRVNIYSQELTDEVELVEKPGHHGIRLFLHSSELLRHPPEQVDDRSAITIWLPRSEERRTILASALHAMARLVMTAPPETGID